VATKEHTEIPADWRERTTVNVPVAGRILADLCRNTSYAAARGDLPTIRLGARTVVPVAKLRRMLGELADEAS
jgi:hypothetical protein